eukprot:364059-Chlamydomonas_euryale.AAC.6
MAACSSMGASVSINLCRVVLAGSSLVPASCSSCAMGWLRTKGNGVRAFVTMPCPLHGPLCHATLSTGIPLSQGSPVPPNNDLHTGIPKLGPHPVDLDFESATLTLIHAGPRA